MSRLDLNPRYVAYMAAHCVTDPDVMVAVDRERWPGGHCCGFLLWNGAHIDRFLDMVYPRKTRGPWWIKGIAFNEAAHCYDAWLAKLYPC